MIQIQQTNWQTKNLEDCLDKVVYTSKVQRKDFLKSGVFPVISQEAEAINGYWNDEKDLFRSKMPVVIFGDHTQVLKYVDFDFVLGADGVKILRPKAFLDSRFFYYFLQSVDLKSLGYARHYRLLKEIEVFYPVPVVEQQRIVKILDQVFEKTAKAKENAEKNLQNAKELFESYLQSVFVNPRKDWDHCMLNDYVKFIDYRGKTPKKTPSGLRLITAKNIKMGYLKKDPQEFIDPKDYDKWMTRGIPRKGDILFTTEAPLGMVAQLDTDEKVAFAQRTIIFQTNEDKIDSTFLKYLLMSSPFQKKILEKGTGATVKGIKASLLKIIPIYFPNIREQKSLVAKFDALSTETKKLEAIYRQKLAKLEELKKSVLKKAFAGEL